jgi:hypothetical protein
MSVTEIAGRGAGGIVAAAVEVFLARWRRLIGVAALFVVPIELLQSYVLRDVETPDAEMAAVFLVFALAYALVVGPILTTALIRGAVEHVTGGDTGVEGLSRIGMIWIPSVLLVSLLYGLAFMGGLLAFVIPGIWLATRLYVATSAVVVEGRRGLDALTRSWRLTGGRFWRTLAVIVLTLGLVLAIVVPVGALVGLAVDGWAAEGLLSGALTSFAAAFSFTVEALLYLHLRANYDLEFDEGVLGDDLARTVTRSR